MDSKKQRQQLLDKAFDRICLLIGESETAQKVLPKEFHFLFEYGGKLASMRLKYYYRQWIKYRLLRYPICLLLDHDLHPVVDWSHHCDTCSRCHRTFNFISHKKP